MGAMSWIHWLVVIIALVVVFSTGGAMMKKLGRGGALDAEALMPTADPTRLVLASLVLRGALLRQEILRRTRNPFIARSLEPSLDMPLIQAVARRLDQRARTSQWILVGLSIASLVLGPFGMFTILALIVAGLIFRWQARFSWATEFKRGSYDIDRIRKAYRVAAEPDVSEEAKVICSGISDPFVGLGVNLGAWNIAIDVSRPALTRQSPPEALTADEVEGALADAITRLKTPGLSLHSALMVSGVESVRIPEIQPDRYKRPVGSIPLSTLKTLRDGGDTSARAYRMAVVRVWEGEVQLTYAFRCVLRGQMLAVEAVTLALPPIDPAYREIDALRAMSPWETVKWVAAGVLWVPFQVIGAFVSISAYLGELIDEAFGGVDARERKEISQNPVYNYGAAWSLRLHVAARNYSNWFQKADLAQYMRGLEEQVLNALRDVLEARGVDVSALANQTVMIHNNNVQVTAGRDVQVSGMAVGVGAAAAAALGRKSTSAAG